MISKVRSLKQHILLLVIGTFILLLSALLLNSFRVESAKIEAELSEIATSVEEYLRDTVSYSTNILLYIGRQIKEHPEQGREAYIISLFETFMSDPRIKDSFSKDIIVWIDENDKVTLDGNLKYIEKDINLSHRDYLSQTKKHPMTVQFGEPIYGSPNNKWMIPAAVGVTNKQGKYIGTLAIGFEIQSIEAYIESLRPRPEMSISLFHKDFGLLSQSFQTKGSISPPEDIETLNEEGGFSFNFITGNNIFYQSISEYSLIVYITYSKSYTYQRLKEAFWRLLPEVIVTIMLITFVFHLFHRLYVKPIFDLSSFAKRISKGRLNATMKPPLYSELVPIAESLYQLRDSNREFSKTRHKIEQTHQMHKIADAARDYYLKLTDARFRHSYGLLSLNQSGGNVGVCNDNDGKCSIEDSSLHITHFRLRQVLSRALEMHSEIMYRYDISCDNDGLEGVTIFSDEWRYIQLVSSILRLMISNMGKRGFIQVQGYALDEKIRVEFETLSSGKGKVDYIPSADIGLDLSVDEIRNLLHSLSGKLLLDQTDCIHIELPLNINLKKPNMKKASSARAEAYN